MLGGAGSRTGRLESCPGVRVEILNSTLKILELEHQTLSKALTLKESQLSEVGGPDTQML